MSGPFGVAFTRWLLQEGYLRRIRGSRVLRVTERGARWFSQLGVRSPAANGLDHRVL